MILSSTEILETEQDKMVLELDDEFYVGWENKTC